MFRSKMFFTISAVSTLILIGRTDRILYSQEQKLSSVAGETNAGTSLQSLSGAAGGRFEIGVGITDSIASLPEEWDL